MKTFALCSFGMMAALAFTAGGCELIASVDHDKIPQGGGAPIGGGGGGTTTASTTGMGGGGGAGGGPACNPDDCPAPASDCLEKACNGADMCEPTNVAADTACNSAPGEGGGTMAGVCDGEGSCVECNGNQQCTAPEVCDTTAHECVPEQCQNGKMDGMETGEDCGGPDCGDCPNGEGCLDAGDCISGFCDGTTCAACTDTGDCGANQWCDTTLNGGTCVATKADGVSCSASEECMSGQCPSNGTGQPTVCCNTACNAGCKACIAALTADNDGTCADVDVGLDPKDVCTNNATNCQADACAAGGVCGNETAGASCGSAQSCTGSTLDPQDTCDATGTCQAGSSGACPNNLTCNAGGTACRTTCTAQTHCVNTHYCVGVDGTTGSATGACDQKKAAAANCAADAECQSGTCTGAPAGTCS